MEEKINKRVAGEEAPYNGYVADKLALESRN